MYFDTQLVTQYFYSYLQTLPHCYTQQPDIPFKWRHRFKFPVFTMYTKPWTQFRTTSSPLSGSQPYHCNQNAPNSCQMHICFAHNTLILSNSINVLSPTSCEMCAPCRQPLHLSNMSKVHKSLELYNIFLLVLRVTALWSTWEYGPPAACICWVCVFANEWIQFCLPFCHSGNCTVIYFRCSSTISRDCDVMTRAIFGNRRNKWRAVIVLLAY